jgi:hypothetical protein
MTADERPHDHAAVIVGLELVGMDEVGDLVVSCELLETVTDAQRWLQQQPVTREISVYVGPSDALEALLAAGRIASTSPPDD